MYLLCSLRQKRDKIKPTSTIYLFNIIIVYDIYRTPLYVPSDVVRFLKLGSSSTSIPTNMFGESEKMPIQRMTPYKSAHIPESFTSTKDPTTSLVPGISCNCW